MQKSKSGFTLVELLIAIVIIAILASLTVISYNGIKLRSQASAVSSGLKHVDKSMRLWAVKTGMTTWPLEPVTMGGRTLTEMINSDQTLKRYLEGIPEVAGIHSEEWFYDNEGDDSVNCANTYSGVNIVIRYIETSELPQQVDTQIDDGNLNCGKVRYVDNRLFYKLSLTQKVNE